MDLISQEHKNTVIRRNYLSKGISFGCCRRQPALRADRAKGPVGVPRRRTDVQPAGGPTRGIDSLAEPKAGGINSLFL